MPIELLREPANPFDTGAIVAAMPGGATIGYVPRDSFLRRAVHEEGKGTIARVALLQPGKRGFVEVVLEVALTGRELGERAYRRPEEELLG